MQIVIDDEWHAINQLKSSGYLTIFITFGIADHSIPLTLYDKLLADTIGLNEWGLRLPMLVAGLLTVVAVPWLFRDRLHSFERLATGALLAISPVLIEYSRKGRPYALTILLCVVAFVSFYRWWQGRGHGSAALYVVCTAFAAWLHLVSLVFTFACPLWAGLLALQRCIRERSFAPMWPLVKQGVITFAVCGLVLLPPLLNDFASLVGKAGMHHVRFETFWVSWEMVTGTGYAPLALAFLALVVYGGVIFYRRDPGFCAYLLFIMVIGTLVITLSQAAWVKWAAVFVRYMVPVAPIILLFAAVGLITPVRRTLSGVPAVVSSVASIAMACLILFAGGPLPKIYQGINQLTNHLSYQFDYDFERSEYQQFLADIEAMPIYHRIRDMALGPGWDIVETPWRLESFYNPFYIYQNVHQLPMRVGFMSGLCSEPFYGEYGMDKEGLQFEYFVHLMNLLRDPGTTRFVIFHLKPIMPHMREIPSVEPCLDAFRQRFGTPWYESDKVVVFRFGSKGEAMHG